MTGQIFNIQKYALHDGPGIRTTIFFKGCPLKCQWCHNPESIRTDQELTFNQDKCIGCNSCDGFVYPEPCPSEALEYVGKPYTVEELMVEILKDHIFYEQSKGGVTFSGGEPLMQSDFLLEVLKSCKEHDIHTTIDTTGFAPWKHIEKLLPYVDLFLYDIKHTNSEMHEKLTGVPNALILENFKKIIRTNHVYLRLILIKDINDDEKHMTEVLRLIDGEYVDQINILPYHNYAENKYNHLMIDSKFIEFEKPTEEKLKSFVRFFESHGIDTYIGG
ncbi:MAG: glycyl-radical enzyme activating protein [Clostridiales bacterium]|nr:glycyl-radical enzyme activating protein [Clostridiales bacterium]